MAGANLSADWKALIAEDSRIRWHHASRHADDGHPELDGHDKQIRVGVGGLERARPAMGLPIHIG